MTGCVGWNGPIAWIRTPESKSKRYFIGRMMCAKTLGTSSGSHYFSTHVIRPALLLKRRLSCFAARAHCSVWIKKLEDWKKGEKHLLRRLYKWYNLAKLLGHTNSPIYSRRIASVGQWAHCIALWWTFPHRSLQPDTAPLGERQASVAAFKYIVRHLFPDTCGGLLHHVESWQ